MQNREFTVQKGPKLFKNQWKSNIDALEVSGMRRFAALFFHILVGYLGCPRERFLAINSGKALESGWFFQGSLKCLFLTTYQKSRVGRGWFGHHIFTWQSTVEILKMAISKILDFSAGSKFAIKLPQNIRYDRESQNCDWMFFSVTPY